MNDRSQRHRHKRSIIEQTYDTQRVC